jgi:hypothetical protein
LFEGAFYGNSIREINGFIAGVTTTVYEEKYRQPHHDQWKANVICLLNHQTFGSLFMKTTFSPEKQPIR